ncbi:MAG: filamentous hemagglutinin family protein, partial [Myxococcota bacterium]
YTIDGGHGVRRDSGSLLIHSFSDFNLESNETALYTETGNNVGFLSGTETVLTRVTGNNPSQIDGIIESDYTNADLFFVNSNGVFFGSDFTLDVHQSFHVSTADFFEVSDLADGIPTQVTTTSPDLLPDITFDNLFAWGFLSPDPANVQVDGFNVLDNGELFPESEFTFVGGDVTFGTDAVPINILTQGRSLRTLAIGRSGRVVDTSENADRDEPGVETTSLTGNPIIPTGTVQLRGTIDTSGLAAENGRIVMVGGVLDLAGTRLDTSATETFSQTAGDVLLFGNDILIDLDRIDTSSELDNAGNVSIVALNDLTISSSSGGGLILTQSLGGASGGVELGALGNLAASNFIIVTGGTGDPSSSGDAQGISVFAGNDVTLSGLRVFDASPEDARAGSLAIVGDNVDISISEFRITSFGDNTLGGDIDIIGFNEINITNSILDVSAVGLGSMGGDISLYAGNDVTLSGQQVFGARISVIAGDDVTLFQSSFFQGGGDGTASGASLAIEGDNVDINNSQFDLSSFGDNTLGGDIDIIGFDEITILNSVFDVSAEGLGSMGGDISLTSASLNEVGAIFATETGGTVTRTILDIGDIGGGIPDFVPELDQAIPVVDSLEQLTSVPLTNPTVDIPFNDPIGFGDLQPVPSTIDVAAAPPEADAAEQQEVAQVVDADEPNALAAVSAAGETNQSRSSESRESDPITEEVEEQIALAVAIAEADSKKEDSSVPGVSLFTNASQRAPLVPRTCESIAGGDTKSRFLARANKRLPTSPEDWLIAFDTSGEQLIAAVENADLPSVAALDSSDLTLEETRRNARTQRALSGAAAAVRGGRYDEAAIGFEDAVHGLEESGDPRGASDVLLAYAQIQLTDGRYLGARQSLERALALAEPLGDEQHTAAVRTSLGNALIGTGELVRAEEELTRGLNIVMASSNDQPVASVLNNLGNRHAATRDFDSAIVAYEKSAKLARKLGQNADEARALSGAARAAAESGHLTEAQKFLERAMPLVDELEDPKERVPLYIHIGTTYAQFAAASPAARSASLISAYTAFDSALKGAEQLGDLRGVALANLNLGALYRDEQYRSEALYLTRLARRAAESIDAPELLYRAHWQEGQILWAEHEVGAALAAHRRAVEILEDTKPVASDGYGSSDANFRIAVGAVYQDTVDLLLQTASMMQSADDADHLIAEARDTLEKFKAAELRDYFEDECIANVSGDGRDIDKLGAKAAVVYTVTFPDRIELIVGLPTGVERYTTKVAAARLIKTVDQFRTAVQNPLSNEHRALGKKIYEWTVAPYADRIAELGIETLVFIPDGRLRTLPFAALSDGEHYISERYATATALSLRLLTSPDIASEPGRPVLAGVSESVQGFSKLAAVDSELAEIQAIEGSGELFLNKEFTLDQIRSAVEREVPGVVHLATHAVFTGNPDTSFLLTYDGRVGFDDLSDVVGMTRADGAPLDLLVLSACETAVGNDRAGLGFTGSAIRAGARSALGSLWPISDAAARELMIDFYKGMQSPETTKAEALRNAQATLRDNERFAHPFYWAPFTLVNDWM